MVFTPNKRKAWSNDFILSKILLSLIWVTFLYLGLNFGIWHRNRKTVHVHSIDIGNSVADASSNQDNFLRSYFFLHACISYKSRLYKGYVYDDRFLLIVNPDVEKNPGPVDCTLYTVCHPNLCPFYRVAIYKVLDQQILLPNDENDNSPVYFDQGLENLKDLFF